jgi:hypothetical protein
MRRDLWDRHLRVSHGVAKGQEGLYSQADEINQGHSMNHPAKIPSILRSADEEGSISGSISQAIPFSALGIDTGTAFSLSAINNIQSDAPWLVPRDITKQASISDVAAMDERRNDDIVTSYYPLADSSFPPEYNLESQSGFFDHATYNDNINWFLGDWIDASTDTLRAASSLDMVGTRGLETNFHQDIQETGDTSHSALGMRIEPPQMLPRVSRDQSPNTDSKNSSFNCERIICRAMTEIRRAELIMWLRYQSPELDYSSSVFSFQNVKLGIHRYSRRFGTEISVFHPTLLVPTSERNRRDILNYYGDETPEVLIWVMIALGWSTMDNEPNADMAVVVYRIVRRFMMEVSLRQSSSYNGSQLNQGGCNNSNTILVDFANSALLGSFRAISR